MGGVWRRGRRENCGQDTIYERISKYRKVEAVEVGVGEMVVEVEEAQVEGYVEVG